MLAKGSCRDHRRHQLTLGASTFPHGLMAEKWVSRTKLERRPLLFPMKMADLQVHRYRLGASDLMSTGSVPPRSCRYRHLKSSSTRYRYRLARWYRFGLELAGTGSGVAG